MKHSIVWSAAAKEDYAWLLAYIEAEFGTDAALKVLDKTESIVEKIARFPKAFPVSDAKPNIHKAVISRQTSLLYRVTDLEIQLLHFWDNRKDPERLSDLP